MGTNFKRRDIVSRMLNKPIPATKDPVHDPYFKKYANTAMPSGARITSGTNQYAGQWTEKEMIHLLRRITFGASRQNVDLIKGMNLPDAVNFLIDNVQLPDSYPVNVYQSMYADTQGVPAGESWVYWNTPDNNDGVLNQNRINYSFKPWWAGLMINQKPHILEKLTLFWANHFGTQTDDFNTPKAIWQHYNTLRSGGTGNFRTLVKNITVDPHMLLFLNGNSNTASAPDENYARELQELFTVGKGLNSAYTEDDVKQAAKILTGWRRMAQPDGFYISYFNDAEHDKTDKQFSSFYNNRIITGQQGQNGKLETDALIDMILSVDETAKYICRCLYRWFVYYVIDDTTEANVITPLAQVFRSNNYEIAPVLKALFLSEHFFDPLNYGCIIKSPVDFYVGISREFNLYIPTSPVTDTYQHWQHFKDRFDEGDQRIGDPPNVAGWPAYYQQPVYYQLWINSDTIQKRAYIMSIYLNDYGFAVTNSTIRIKIDSVAFNKLFSAPQDPNQVVANFCLYLLPQDVSASQIAYMKNILLNGGQDHYWTDAWLLYMGNQSISVNEGVVRGRLNILISYITNLEEYQLY